MGEVYKATDTRLDRFVAIKVLPTHLSSDPDRRERFDREARAISSLNHPHICTLHDVGHQDGIDFLVMELVEGESLADRLARGALPLDQALQRAIEIADALSAAHRRGIVHRDLKPSNVMLTKSGAKLLDFGLAKLGGALARQRVDLTAAPTQTKPLTEAGTILGTFQYMAPEQIEGGDADARSDVFAFGALLYQMVTGKAAFEGKSQASLIAAILEKDPAPIATQQPLTPPSLDRVVRMALAKDPDDRWQSAHDLTNQLRWIAEGRSQVGVPAPIATRRLWRERLAWTLLAVTVLATVAVASLLLNRPATVPATVLFEIQPPDKHPFASTSGLLSVSPDGRLVAFVASTRNSSATGLWIRPFDTLAARPLAGTENATLPTWSPDSRFLLFTDAVTGHLNKVSISGGTPVRLADYSEGTAWSKGVILFTGADGRLYRIPDTGGAAVAVAELDRTRAEINHGWPIFLSDGRRFIFLAQSGDKAKTGLDLASLDTPGRTRLVDVQSNAAYAQGYLLYQRDGTLFAHRFDEKAGRIAGDAAAIAADVEHNSSQGRGAFSVAANGALVYRSSTGSQSYALTWFDRRGALLGTIGDAGQYCCGNLSHDRRRFVVARQDDAGNGNLWVFDLGRNVSTRLTSGPGQDFFPIWSPDDRSILFGALRNGMGKILQLGFGSTAREETIFESPEPLAANSVSPDGKTLLFCKVGSKYEIWALPLTGDRKPFTVASTPFNNGAARFSPDGRWIVYHSDESGTWQVYVQSFPTTSGKTRVSTTNGLSPDWSADGKRIFYVTLDGEIMAVDTTKTDTELEPRLPMQLFKVPVVRGNTIPNFTVDPSGSRFLIAVPTGAHEETPLTVVVNWQGLLKK